MKTVYKYPIPEKKSFSIELPKYSKILHVAAQQDNPCIWVQVETKNESEKRNFELYGTGHEIGDSRHEKKYIGTYQVLAGMFVYHLYELL